VREKIERACPFPPAEAPALALSVHNIAALRYATAHSEMLRRAQAAGSVICA